MTDNWKIGAIVKTPNGDGRIEGVMFENGQHLLIVRHKLPIQGTAGTNQTPAAKLSGLWSYQESEVKGDNARP